MGAVYRLHQEGFIQVNHDGTWDILLEKNKVDLLQAAVQNLPKFLRLGQRKGKKRLAYEKQFLVWYFVKTFGARQIRVQDVRMTYKLLGRTIGERFIRRELKRVKFLRNRFGFTREEKPRKKHRIFRPSSFDYWDESLFE
jgi:hypothetical protein